MVVDVANSSVENGIADEVFASEWTSGDLSLTFDSLREDYLEQARAVAEARRTGRKPGPTTGFPALDGILGGWWRPGLYALHAQAGAGKSAFALQMAVDSGFAALYVTAEMSPNELLRRHISRVNRVNINHLGTGKRTEAEEMEMLQVGLNTAKHLHVIDATDGVVLPRVIAKKAIELKQQYGHVAVIIDSINPWSEAQGAALGLSEYDSIARGIAALRKVSKATRSPVLFIAERAKANSKQGGLDAMAGHRRLSFGPDVVMEMLGESDQEAYEAGHFGSQEIVTVRLNKNRWGQGKNRQPLRFAFSGETMTFSPR